MPNYIRPKNAGASWFFTVNALDRRSTILTDHIGALRQAIAKVKQRHPFTIDAMAVRPDHLHAVWSLPAGDADFSARWRLIKSQFSRALPAVDRRSRSRIERSERGIWQRRFWEHAIRDESDYQRHVAYCYLKSGEAWLGQACAGLAVFVVPQGCPGRIVAGRLGGFGGRCGWWVWRAVVEVEMGERCVTLR